MKKAKLIFLMALLPFLANAQNNMSENTGETERPPIDHFTKCPVVVAKKSILLRGERYVADVVMVNADPTSTYTVYIRDEKIEGNRISFICNSVGTKHIGGYVLEEQKKGKRLSYPFSMEYAVTEPGIEISTNKTDILYAGVPSIISIRESNVFAPIEASIDGASTRVISEREGWGEYEITPDTLSDKCNVHVITRDGYDNKRILIGGKLFGVIPLPRPTAYIRISSEEEFNGGLIEKKRILSANEVFARMDEKNLSNLEVNVLSFDMKFFGNGGSSKILHSKSGEITEQMRKEIGNLKSGATFLVTNISVKTPDERIRMLSPIELIIK